jgi:hypothetical protein
MLKKKSDEGAKGICRIMLQIGKNPYRHIYAAYRVKIPIDILLPKGLIYMCCNNTLTHVCRIGLESPPYPKQCIIVSTRLSSKEKKRKSKKVVSNYINLLESL